MTMDLLWKHIKGETGQSSGGKAKINGTVFARAQTQALHLSAGQSRGLSNANVSTDSIFYTSATESQSDFFPFNLHVNNR